MDKLRKVLPPLVLICLLLIGWWAAVLKTNSAIFPTPLQVVTGTLELIEDGSLWEHIGSSLMRVGVNWAAGGQPMIRGPEGMIPNPAYGAPISYFLKGEVKELALRIRDAAGTQVREITGNDVRNARKAGINRVQWDLRHQPLAAAAGAPQGGGGGFGGGGNNGPHVLPGEYRVTLVVDGKEIATKPLRVLGDSAIQITDADRKTLHDTALGLHTLQRSANEAADAVTELSRQHQALDGLMKGGAASAEAKTALEDANKRLTDLRRRLGVPAPGQPAGGGGGGGFGGGANPNVRAVIGQVKGQMMASTSLPTATQMRQATEAREDLAKVIEDVNAAISTTMPALYKQVGGQVTPLKPLAALGTGQ